MRILIRDYQARSSERWIERLIEQRRDSAENPANLIEQDAFEREILGRNVSEATN